MILVNISLSTLWIRRDVGSLLVILCTAGGHSSPLASRVSVKNKGQFTTKLDSALRELLEVKTNRIFFNSSEKNKITS